MLQSSPHSLAGRSPWRISCPRTSTTCSLPTTTVSSSLPNPLLVGTPAHGTAVITTDDVLWGRNKGQALLHGQECAAGQLGLAALGCSKSPSPFRCQIPFLASLQPREVYIFFFLLPTFNLKLQMTEAPSRRVSYNPGECTSFFLLLFSSLEKVELVLCIFLQKKEKKRNPKKTERMEYCR